MKSVSIVFGLLTATTALISNSLDFVAVQGIRVFNAIIENEFFLMVLVVAAGVAIYQTR